MLYWWCGANGVEYKTYRRSRLLVRDEGIDHDLRVVARGDKAPSWTDKHKNLTGRLMGDPPPGRTPWA